MAANDSDLMQRILTQYPLANGVGNTIRPYSYIVFHWKGIPWERSTSDGHDGMPVAGSFDF
ncbi:MAG: hypothetical protein R2778_05905 [Saprospiraceae bacterium]